MDPKFPTDDENFITEMIEISRSVSIPIDASQLELLASLEKGIVESQKAFEQYKDEAIKLEEGFKDCIKVREGIISERLAKLKMKPGHNELIRRLQAMHEDLSKGNEQHHSIFRDNPHITLSTGQDKSEDEIESLHGWLDQEAHNQGSDSSHSVDDYLDITHSTGLPNCEEEILSLNACLNEEAHHQGSDNIHSANVSFHGKTVVETSPNIGSLLNSDGERNANVEMHKSLQDNPNEKSVRDGSLPAEIASKTEELHKSLQHDIDLETALDQQIMDLAVKVDSLKKENEQRRNNLQSAKK